MIHKKDVAVIQGSTAMSISRRARELSTMEVNSRR